MNHAQLLALDTILPSLLGFGGLVFLALGLVPLVVRRGWSDVPVTLALVVVGAGCIALGVVLWTRLLASGTSLASPAQPGIGVVATPTSDASAVSPAATAAGASSAEPAPSSTPTASPSSSAATATPAPTATLVPVAAVSFQPDSGSAHDITVALEPFEHGTMLYRSDRKWIYVLAEAGKTFKVYPDTWDESQPASAGLTPPAGKVEPRRGFGKLWRADPTIGQTLGWALAAETGMGAQVSGSATTTEIHAGPSTYVFRNDGTYRVH
ncbi:MAG: hypothetical protein ACYDAG_05190 [Chloroflexota bacterium]